MIRMVLGLSLLCTIAAFGLTKIFPQGEQWVSDWQLARMVPGPVDPSIVLIIATEPDSPVFCGEGRWNFDRLEATLLALHQAKAAVIAPSIDGSASMVSECGGLPGLVRLAEATKRIGSIVYPDTVPPILAEAATAVGTMALKPDKDGLVRKIKLSSPSSESRSYPPFGLAIASFSKGGTAMKALPIGPEPRYVGSWKDSPFPAHDFGDVWNLIQARDFIHLTNMFQGKVVILFALGRGDPTISTPWEFSVPEEFFHTVSTNAVLTNGWIARPPLWIAALVTAGLSMLFAFFLLRASFPTFLVLISLASLLSLAGYALFWGLNHGWVWPILSTGLALVMTAGGTIVWRMYMSRLLVQRRITQGRKQLKHLETELTEKQHYVRDLETQLYAAQGQANQSATAIEGLQATQGVINRQLEISQADMENTRRQIDRLQKELHNLRSQVPASPKASPVTPVSGDDQALLDECASFNILTRNPLVLRVFQDLKKAAVTQSPILLLGETGTGKEVFAKAAHALSLRHPGPFVSVNMAAIRSELFEGELFGHVRGAFTGAIGREGFIEASHGGTLFLDEVGELPWDLQAKLLRFLEEGTFYRVGESRLTTVDVRIIAATNRELQKDVEAGRYREDLYYRLRSIVLTLPPLRQRGKEDRLLLAQTFLEHFSRQKQGRELKFTQGALDAIDSYPWPGNIRELRQTLAQAIALVNGPLITEEDLHLSGRMTPPGQGEGQGKEELGQLEDSMVLECLRRYRFDMQATAKALGWDRSTVTQRLKGLGFQAVVAHQGDIEAAARSLAGNVALTRVVEGRLREYSKNLLPSSKQYASVDEAIADCRKRFRNLPERHFPAVEQLVQQRFSTSR